MLGGVPANLSAGADALADAATSARDSALAVDAAGSRAGGACGDGPVGPAIDRFTAAWSGEFVSWALGATQMSQVAFRSGEAITAATGGG